jgi:osmotically-inducible protein OsmY
MIRTNTQITDNVRAQLDNDPRVPFPDEIAIEALEGAVTLRGTVGSFAQRRAAVADAKRSRGVVDVLDELMVRPLDEDRREDAEIRGAAIQRLIWDPDIAASFVDVNVKDGWVTLTGEVDFQFQSDNAFHHVETLRGVTGITNKIKVVEAL